MRWALENKSWLIPAFGYVKRRHVGERIKARAKLAYIQGASGEKKRWSERERGCRLETLHGAMRGALPGPRLATHTHYYPALVLHINTHSTMHTD